jgi:hypothetical protein
VDGVDGTFGLAVVTPVSGPASAQAIVPAAPLAGSFTQANTSAGAAFGGNAIGRLAVTGSGSRAAPGSDVDGAAVRYQRFTPSALVIPIPSRRRSRQYRSASSSTWLRAPAWTCAWTPDVA